MRAIDLQAAHDLARMLVFILACCGASVVCGVILLVRRWPR